MSYSPIAVFVYRRPDKTKRLFDSLLKNHPASESEVFVFSDGPKDESAAEGVEEVRNYLNKTVRNAGFKSVTIYESETNKGLAGSVIEGVTLIIGRFGRIIVLEDDLVLSEYFLDYMNECLDFYKDDDRIWSISAYSSIDPADDYDKNVYLNYRASSWGWGTWKDRWDLVDWSMSDYNRFRFDPIANIRLCYGGNDLPSMLRAQMKGKMDSWAVRWCYHQAKYDKLSVAPIRSLVQNEGFDGSGVHCGPGDVSGFGRVVLEDEKRDWIYEDLKIDKKLVRLFYKQHHLSLFIRVRDKIKEIL